MLTDLKEGTQHMSIYKTCPKCNEKHVKSGIFCSRSCANSRKWSDKDKKKKSASAKKSNKLRNHLEKVHQINTTERVSIKCYICDKEILVPYSQKNNKITCKSKTCILQQKRLAGKNSANLLQKRSKQEIELYNLLSMHFENVDHNKQIANGWDSDIILYDYKIAILWNGPWHYREMNFGNHSLYQVVNRDLIKIQEFEKIGWNVLIYQDNYYTPQEALIDVLLFCNGSPVRTRTAIGSVMSTVH